MEIICKCGHDATEHKGPFGCMAYADRLHNLCECRLSIADCYLVYITEQQARLDTNRAQVEALIAERDKAVLELGERRENFTVMLNRLLEAEQKYSKTRAQLSYVLADNAQLRAVLVQVLEYLDDASGGARSFPETLKNLKMSLNIMGDPRENND